MELFKNKKNIVSSGKYSYNFFFSQFNNSGVHCFVIDNVIGT